MIKQDEYQTVLNHNDTFDYIADELHDTGKIIFAWTDGYDTQLDILMCYRPIQFGRLQRGMKTTTDLFVAVSGHGMFGFELNSAWKSPGYVAEKLNLGSGGDSTSAELSELINGVINRL